MVNSRFFKLSKKKKEYLVNYFLIYLLCDRGVGKITKEQFLQILNVQLEKATTTEQYEISTLYSWCIDKIKKV